MVCPALLKVLFGDLRPTGRRNKRGRTDIARTSASRTFGLDVDDHDVVRNNTNGLSYGKRCATTNAIRVRAAAALEDVGGAARDQDIRA